MAEELGKYLESGRIEKGLTTEEVADATRFNIRFIKMAEAGRFEELPGDVFIKGLLRSYALLLDIDGADLIARYKSLEIACKDNSPKMISMPLHGDEQAASPVVLGLALVVALGIVGAVYTKFGEVEIMTPNTPVALKQTVRTKQTIGKISAVQDVTVEPADRISPDDESTDGVAESEPVDMGEAASSPEHKKAEEVPDTPTPAEPLTEVEEEDARLKDTSLPYKLTVAAHEDSWVKVEVDGAITRDLFVREGKQISWRGAEQFKLTIGNVAGTKIYFNDEPVALEQPASNVITNMTFPRQ